MGIKNWLGLPAHPTDEWLFWNTSQKDMEHIRATYDLLTSKFTKAEKELFNTFVEVMQREAILDENFNQSEDA